MEIKIYGTGCKNCVKLAENAKKAVKELGIDGKVKVKGRVPDVEEIKELIS